MFTAYGMDSNMDGIKITSQKYTYSKFVKLPVFCHSATNTMPEYTHREANTHAHTHAHRFCSRFYCITLNWSECECDCVWQIKELWTTTPNNGKEMDNNR